MQQGWGIATSVGLTALGVASARAIETSRDDPLVVDPFAEAFVKAVQLPFPMPTTLKELEDFSPPDSWIPGWRYIGVRTRFFDDFFEHAWLAGIRQAVILGSGLDARAFRLDWPDGTAVFEIDQPKVIEFKAGVLADLGAHPHCHHAALPLDLTTSDWGAALERAGLDRTQPTAWLAEGLLPYLPPEEEQRLLDIVHELSSPGSRIAIEDAKKLSEAIPDTDFEFDLDAAAEMGVDLRDIVHEDDRRRAGVTLEAMGWWVIVEPVGGVAERYNFPLDRRLATTVDASAFVIAKKD